MRRPADDRRQSSTTTDGTIRRLHNVREVDEVPYNAAQILSKRPVYQDWKKVKFGKKEPRVPGKHDFSFRLEATKKDGVQTGDTPRPNAPRPPPRPPRTAPAAETKGCVT